MEQHIEAGTPLDTLTRLLDKLNNRGNELKRYGDYYEGRHRLAFSSQKFRNAFGGMFSAFADNWCPLVVDAVEERLNVEGFRHGIDPKADADAWDIWQKNGLDAKSQLAHTQALIYGDAFVIVWGDQDGEPIVSVESANNIIVEYAPNDRTKRTAAIKRWDADGGTYCTLFLPNAVFKFFRTKNGAFANTWQPANAAGEPFPLPNPLGVVPVVPLINRPSLTSDHGISEFASVIPQQDAANKLLADLLVASEFIAFPQRYVTGLEIPTDDQGNAIAPFEISMDKLLIAENPDAKFGSLSAGDLNNYVAGIELLVQHIASQTRTPPHYFYLSGNFPSGDAIKSAETGLVAKSRRKMRFFGEAWEEVMRLCFAVLGDARADVDNAETIWADPEFRSESELADALVKRSSIGVPRQQLWEDAGYSQTQIARFREMELADSMDSFLKSAPVVPPVAPAPTEVAPAQKVK